MGLNKLVVGALLCVGVSVSNAEDIESLELNTFQAGQTASADEVNENFTAIEKAVVTNHNFANEIVSTVEILSNRIATLEATLAEFEEASENRSVSGRIYSIVSTTNAYLGSYNNTNDFNNSSLNILGGNAGRINFNSDGSGSVIFENDRIAAHNIIEGLFTANSSPDESEFSWVQEEGSHTVTITFTDLEDIDHSIEVVVSQDGSLISGFYSEEIFDESTDDSGDSVTEQAFQVIQITGVRLSNVGTIR